MTHQLNVAAGERAGLAPVVPLDPDLDFALSVVRGLSERPRRLESRFLYDSPGSAIFESICEQPEYYLTRAEASILQDAADDIARRTGDVRVIELGSGSSTKTQTLLRAYTARFGAVGYMPVDVSSSALDAACESIAASCPAAAVDILHGTYEQVFPLLGSLSPLMLVFLGSSVGNLDAADAAQFWSLVGSSMRLGDYFLLGIDINDDAEELHMAYNDAAGHSAAFTRNLFARMNRDLGSRIDVAAIEHAARYVPQRQRVEIHALFTEPQRVRVPVLGADFQVEADATVLTEISRKFRLDQIVPYLSTFGLDLERMYTDETSRFAVLLLART